VLGCGRCRAPLALIVGEGVRDAPEIEQARTMAAAICSYGFQRIRIIRGANAPKLTMSPPLKAQVRGLKWDPQRLRLPKRDLRGSADRD
jgi:hypothetical protein